MVDFSKRRTVALLLMLGLYLAIFNSCTPERRIARTYMASLPKTGFVVLPPNHVFMSNLRTTPENDSAAITNSLFLKDIVDSAFLTAYTETFIGELRAYGMPVNDTTLPYPLMDSTGSTIVVDLAQMVLEEYLFTYRDSAYYDTMLVYRDFELNGVSLNTWIDLSGVDGSRKHFITLFHSYEVADKVDGAFKVNLITGDILYDYTLYEMQPVLLESMPQQAARMHASYLIDFLINEEVKSKMPEERATPILRLHYDRYLKALKYDRTREGFLLME